MSLLPARHTQELLCALSALQTRSSRALATTFVFRHVGLVIMFLVPRAPPVRRANTSGAPTQPHHAKLVPRTAAALTDLMLAVTAHARAATPARSRVHILHQEPAQLLAMVGRSKLGVCAPPVRRANTSGAPTQPRHAKLVP